jgi:diguanylate cyclase (GGDEF)-like protein/hemerythrin-like metal-binding protein/PAS domain S-box-containing protein
MAAADAAAAMAALLRDGTVAQCIVRDGWLTYVNDAFAQLFALPEPRPVTRVVDLAAHDDRATIAQRLRDAGSVANAPRFGFRALLPDGSTREVEFVGAQVAVGGAAAIAAIVVDVSERQRKESRLSSLAFVDGLTGLPNRALFMDRLREAFVAVRGGGIGFALLVADLDGFKEVNDRYGHDAGDLVLQVVARRLRGTARTNDTIARLGGDEFALILPAVSTVENAALVAGRIVRAIGEPIALGQKTSTVGISVGIGVHPSHGDTMDALFHAADTAMFHAKRQGKNRYALAEAAAAHADTVALRFVEWSQTAMIGVEIIDNQHRRLTDLINALGEDLKAIRSRAELQATLARLFDYAQVHFATEERLLELHAPTQLDRHRRSHRRLLEDLTSLAAGVDEQSMALTMRYLQDWLFLHIEAADRPLGEALNAQGIR